MGLKELIRLGATTRLEQIAHEISELEAFLGGSGTPQHTNQPKPPRPKKTPHLSHTKKGADAVIVATPPQRSPAVLAMMKANKKRYAERRRQQRLAEAGQSAFAAH